MSTSDLVLLVYLWLSGQQLLSFYSEPWCGEAQEGDNNQSLISLFQIVSHLIYIFKQAETFFHFVVF